MKRFLLMISMIVLLSGCSNVLQADDFDIGFRNNYYTEHEVDQKTLQSLVDAFNSMEVIGETSEEINEETFISINFIYKDQISNGITIDDKGIFQTKDYLTNHQLHSDDPFYETALKIYKEIEEQF